MSTGRHRPIDLKPDAMLRKEVPQAPRGTLRVRPKSKVEDGQMSCVQIAVENPSRKESQEPRKYQKGFPTMWNRQSNATLLKRSGQTVQTMQSEHKKADGRISVDEKRTPLIPSQRNERVDEATRK